MTARKTRNPIEAWFRSLGWSALPFQRQAWRAYKAGGSGLVHAPTGFGKTFAAFGGPALEALDNDAKKALQVLWITPMRALANDTADSLRKMLEGICLDWEVALRHGDISSAARQRLRKQLPEVLITTPESLCLLLSYKNVTERFGRLKCIVCDEWHELLGNKRGVQTELALARLKTLAPAARIWGLSATIGNLDEARDVLLGSHTRGGVIIRGRHEKKIKIETLMPDTIDNFPWAGHLGIRLLTAVIERIQNARTTLVFTNTRNQAELWYRHLLSAAPQLADTIGIHHGSMDREARGAVEAGLDDGSLRAVVCTSSLDLGVDFSPVSQVIQIGSPKGIARLTQRAGRSGHQPGKPSTILGVPTNALEILEFAAAREALKRGEIEPRTPLKNAVDVLLQHVITIALSECVSEKQLQKEVLSTAAFRNLHPDDWQWVMGFAKGELGALSAYPEYQKVAVNGDGKLNVPATAIARFHRMSIGTITSDSEILVKYQRGPTLGQVEERFLGRLKPGDTFHFAGRHLKLVRMRGMTAYVANASRKGGVTPAWAGGRTPLSSELAAAVARELTTWQGRPSRTSAELTRLSPLLEIQTERSELPAREHLLIEFSNYKRTWNLFAYPLAGRLVHEGLAALCAYRLSAGTPLTLKTTVNDYGFSIQSTSALPADTEDDLRRLFATENLAADLLECINASELGRRQFREIARIACLVFQGYPGQQKSSKSVQMSSGLLYDVIEKYDNENRLLDQARQEILDRQLEQTRLMATLQRLEAHPLKVVHCEKFSPFAFPLWAEALHQQVSSESWADRVSRLAAEQETAHA